MLRATNMTEAPGLLEQIFSGLAAFAEQRWAGQRQRHQRLAVLHDVIERVVDASEPRIRLVGNYAEKLADAVEIALQYANQILQQLPPAMPLSAQSWSQNPQVNAFFATAGDLRTVLGEASNIQKFFTNQPHEQCFALMLMLKRESETFGPVLNGDVLVREVRRIQVSFAKHQLLMPAASEPELREELKQRMLIFLAKRASERLQQLRERRSTLEELRRQLHAQLRTLRMQAANLHLPGDAPEMLRVVALEQRLCDTESELVAARKPLETLDDYLLQIQQVLSNPEQYLEIRPLTVRLNRLGIKLSAESTESGETLNLIEFDSLGKQNIGALVWFAKTEVPPAPPDPLLQELNYLALH